MTMSAEEIRTIEGGDVDAGRSQIEHIADRVVRVTREPRTYEPHSLHSFFRDLVRYAMDRDHESSDRLSRHQHETFVDRREAKLSQEQRDKLDDAQVEYRLNPNVALGTGGEFDPPAWMIPLFASAGRAGRAYADLIDQNGNCFPLPGGVQSIHIPRLSTGTSTGVQADGAGVSDTDAVTADAASAVVTIAGQEDVSQQLYDLTPAPGLDAVFFKDLSKRYNANLDTQLITGTGGAANTPGAQINGLTSVSGIPATNKVNGAGLNTIATQWPGLGQVAANVSNNRLLPPEALLMAGRRYFWIASSVDSSQRPLSSPGQGPHAAGLPNAGGATPFGPLVGLPAYLCGAIAAGTTADSVYYVRPSEQFLWESAPKFLAVVNATGGTLQVRLSLHRYVAAVLDRYPTGIGILQNLPQPTNF